jgi:hypothetical protein
MADLERFLRQAVQQVEPTALQKAGASRSHNFLRDLLATGNMARVISESYLSGSYARDTAIAPLDDVDIIFLIQPEHWQSGIDSFLGLRPSPKTVLSTFANAIRRRYDQSSVYVQRRSVRLNMNHLDIDVVPALPSAKDSHTILVGDADSDAWLESAPKKHEALASRINAARGNNFKPLVKLLKSWNRNLPSTANLKSFAIETMAARIFDSHSFGSLQDGLIEFFDFMCFLGGTSTVYSWKNTCGISFDWFQGRVIPDTAGTGSNLLANVDGTRIARFVEHAKRSRDKIIEAVNSTYSDTAERRLVDALRL